VNTSGPFPESVFTIPEKVFTMPESAQNAHGVSKRANCWEIICPVTCYICKIYDAFFEQFRCFVEDFSPEDLFGAEYLTAFTIVKIVKALYSLPLS